MEEYRRIIPCLDVKNGRVVKGIQFIELRDAGDPVEFARFYEKEGADELVFLDITATIEKRKTVRDLVKKIADSIDIPFAVGGGIASMEDVEKLLNAGADKVSINTAAVKNPELLSKISDEYGSKRLVSAIDAKRVYINSKQEVTKKILANINGKYCWFDLLTHGGSNSTGQDAIKWAIKVKDLGVGEILPTSKTFDGTKDGYDLEMTRLMANKTEIPIIASGGAGKPQHILEAFTEGMADAALAASIFHFREYTIKEVKEYCMNHGVKMNL